MDLCSLLDRKPPERYAVVQKITRDFYATHPPATASPASTSKGGEQLSPQEEKLVGSYSRHGQDVDFAIIPNPLGKVGGGGLAFVDQRYHEAGVLVGPSDPRWLPPPDDGQALLCATLRPQGSGVIWLRITRPKEVLVVWRCAVGAETQTRRFVASRIGDATASGSRSVQRSGTMPSLTGTTTGADLNQRRRLDRKAATSVGFELLPYEYVAGSTLKTEAHNFRGREQPPSNAELSQRKHDEFFKANSDCCNELLEMAWDEMAFVRRKKDRERFRRKISDMIIDGWEPKRNLPLKLATHEEIWKVPGPVPGGCP